MDTTYTVELTESQYAALLGRAAELEIPLEVNRAVATWARAASRLRLR